MREIARDVYYETSYPGVTLGVICLANSLVVIDAPPRQDDIRAWRTSLVNLNCGVERMLINLDAHFDRTLGGRGMECTVVGHEKTAEIFRSRSTTFKSQPTNTGAEWENLGGLGSIRWAPPDISFSHDMTLNWGDHTVIIESHPGSNPGALWVVLPEQKVVFAGDAVTPNQPPFLATADLHEWIQALELLHGPKYIDYAVISGRGDVVTPSQIKAEIDLLHTIQRHLNEMHEQSAPTEKIDLLIPELLRGMDFPETKKEQYRQRFHWGLTHLYAHPSSTENGYTEAEN